MVPQQLERQQKKTRNICSFFTDSEKQIVNKAGATVLVHSQDRFVLMCYVLHDCKAVTNLLRCILKYNGAA